MSLAFEEKVYGGAGGYATRNDPGLPVDPVRGGGKLGWRLWEGIENLTGFGGFLVQGPGMTDHDISEAPTGGRGRLSREETPFSPLESLHV